MTGAGGTQAVPPQLPGWIQQHRKQLAVCAGAVVAAYLGYRAYHSKSAAQLSKVKRTVQDYLLTLSAISGSVSVVANDLHTFLNSDADELPRSLRQLNKLLQSPDVQATVTNTATSLATSLSAVVANATSSSGSSSSSSSAEPVLQTVLDAVLSDRGRSLVGMAVGLATKNATATFCEFLERTMQRQQGPAAEPGAPGSSSAAAAAAAATGPTDSAYLNTALSLLASEQGERVLSLLITKSIKTAVSTYIDCTTGYNVYEDMVASIAKQEHRDAVSDIMSRITAAFCRELAAAYRRATRASQQQHHHHHHSAQQQQHMHTAAGQPAGAPLSCSSASSSSNSVISLAGHLQTSTTEGLHLCKAPGPVVGRYSSNDAAAVAAACTAELQPRMSAGSANGCGNGAQSLLGAPVSNRLSAGGNGLKANAPRVALNASTAAAAQPQPLLPPQPFSAAGLLASQPAVALDLLTSSSCGGSGSGSAWWRPLVDLAREQHVRSLTLDVVRSATREATRSTWESLFSSSSTSSGAGGLTAWLFGGAVGAAEPSLQQQQQWAMYRMYAVCTVLISLFMYAVSPRVIAVSH